MKWNWKNIFLKRNWHFFGCKTILISYFCRLPKKWLQCQTGWQSEELNILICVLPKLTEIMGKQFWKLRAIKEIGTVLVLNKSLLWTSSLPQKIWVQTHTNWHSEKLSGFLRVLPKNTEILSKGIWWYRFFRYRVILLVMNQIL